MKAVVSIRNFNITGCLTNCHLLMMDCRSCPSKSRQSLLKLSFQFQPVIASECFPFPLDPRSGPAGYFFTSTHPMQQPADGQIHALKEWLAALVKITTGKTLELADQILQAFIDGPSSGALYISETTISLAKENQPKIAVFKRSQTLSAENLHAQLIVMSLVEDYQLVTNVVRLGLAPCFEKDLESKSGISPR